MRITENRKDLTDWLIHFVNDRNPDNDMFALYNRLGGREEGLTLDPSKF